MAINNNQKREQFLDLGKGIAVVLLIQVHLMEVFALPEIYRSPIGAISLFLGGPMVAPLFLCILGFLIAKKKYSISNLIVRGSKLLALGLILNIGINFHLILLIISGKVNVNPWEYIFGVDILISAGLFILTIAGFRLLFRNTYFPYLIAAFLIIIATPFISKICTVNTGFKYFLALIGGDYSWSYFPLFPWIVYPLMGYSTYLIHIQYGKKLSISYHFKIIGFFLLSLITVFLGFFLVSGIIDLTNYYHHGYKEFLWILLLLILWFNFLKALDVQCGKSSLILYLKWLGKNVTIAYVIQWLIIGNIGTALYKTQSLDEMIVWFILIILAMSSTLFAIEKAISSWNRQVDSSKESKIK